MSNKKYFWEWILTAVVMCLVIWIGISLLIICIKILIYLIWIIW